MDKRGEGESKAKVAPALPLAAPNDEAACPTDEGSNTALSERASISGARPEDSPPTGLEPCADGSSSCVGAAPLGEGKDLAPLPSPPSLPSSITEVVRGVAPAAVNNEATLLTPLPEEKIHLAMELGRRRARRSGVGPRVAIPAETYRFSNALTPDMFEIYLALARGRCAGVDVGILAEKIRVDEELVERIVVSPLYMAFEATFRRAMNSGTELEAVAQRLAEVAPATVERLIWWSEQTSPQTAAVALAAIKMILSANGVTTEKKSVERSRTTMSPDQQARLLAVFEVKRR